MPYNVVVKNAWKRNDDWPRGLEPDGYGEPATVIYSVQTEAEAQEFCRSYNATHEPGILNRRAGYEDDGRDTPYNGYPNYATWNVSLWIDNKEAWYRAKCALLESLTSPVTAGEVRWLVDGIELPRLNTDLDVQQWRFVDWDHLAGHWEEQRLEMLGQDPSTAGHESWYVVVGTEKNGRRLAISKHSAEPDAVKNAKKYARAADAGLVVSVEKMPDSQKVWPA